jgi:hypothetical protein
MGQKPEWWHISYALPTEGLVQQMCDCDENGFSGFSVFPCPLIAANKSGANISGHLISFPG